MSGAASGPWWRGERGEWFVVAQFALGALELLAPRRAPGWAPWPAALARPAHAAGLLLLLAGLLLLAAGGVRLGRRLTALPAPKPGSDLVATGPYRLVRHPMYAGVVLLALGWALRVGGTLTLLYAAALVALLDVKARREEHWLRAKYPGYAEYCRRVKRFVPFVY